MTTESQGAVLAKVPAITAGFWVIKILATTLGETAGDTLSMSVDLGYLLSTLVFGIILVLLVAVQIAARGFRPSLYWTTIIASTTAGTTLADFATRSLGIGYPGGSFLLLLLVVASLAAWRAVTGSIAVESVANTRSESFYWLTITFSQTLGTALGDWVADSNAMGYLGGALIFGAALAALLFAWRYMRVSHTLLFWAAFILTRPLGATVGDYLDKPVIHGGLAFSRPLASLVLFGAIVLLILLIPQRGAQRGWAR